MIRSRLAALAGVLLIGSVAQATWYTSEASFLAAINPTYYLENFNNFTFGSPLAGDASWAAPGANGYGWTATTLNSAGTAAGGGLYSNVGALSTNVANDRLVLTFSGSPVSAFGGNVANSDINGALIPGTVTITLSDNTTQSIVFPTAAEGFLGWAGPQVITSVQLFATGTTNNWVQLDHAYTGASAVPEPMTVTGLAIGALALLRRRKKA
jgi:hypothetical protein